MLEVPSGVWADLVSRRALLTLAPLLAGAGFALWVLVPGYPAFAAGFVLWGAQGALTSGALEALVYEELEREGEADGYATLMGRATALGTIAAAAAIGLAAPLYAVGGFLATGIASVAACGLAAVAAAGFPEPRDGPPREDDPATVTHVGLRAMPGVLRAAVADVRASGALRRVLLAVPLVTAVWGSLDEYLPLLAVESGAALEDVPLLGLLVYALMSLGGLAAGRAGRLPGRRLAGVLLAAAGALAAGALVRAPAGFLLVAVAFAGFQAVTVVLDARLQDTIGSTARATTTSLAGLVTEILVIAVFAGYAAGSALMSHATLFALFAVLYAAIAVLVDRALAGAPRLVAASEPA